MPLQERGSDDGHLWNSITFIDTKHHKLGMVRTLLYQSDSLVTKLEEGARKLEADTIKQSLIICAIVIG